MTQTSSQTIKRRSIRGASLPLALMFFMVVGLITVAAIGVTTTGDNMAFRASLKAQANSLAEAAVQDLYDQAVRQLANGDSALNDLPTKNVTNVLTGKTREMGRFNGKILSVNVNKVFGPAGYPATAVEYNYKVVIQGHGIATNGVDSYVTASFTASQVHAADGGTSSSDTFQVYPAAIESNTTIELATDARVQTIDSSPVDKQAHLLANQGIVWNTVNKSKSAVFDPDIIKIDGQAYVAIQPTMDSYNMTTGASGLGNSNGSKNYVTLATSYSPLSGQEAKANEISMLDHIKQFSSQGDLLTTFTANAPSNTAMITSKVSTSLKADLWTGLKTIKAPAIISSDFQVSANDSVQIVPADDPSANVVFVKGNLQNLGKLLNLGVTVVVTGNYSDSPTAVYTTSTKGSPFSDQLAVYEHASLIAMSYEKSAVSISSNVDSNPGLIAALNGGIDITGTQTLSGILMSGGRDLATNLADPATAPLVSAKGKTFGSGVFIRPLKGKSFTLNYIRSSVNYALPKLVSGGTATLNPLTATKLADWNQSR